MITHAPAEAVLARYSFRQSVLEPEKTYSLYPDRLEVDWHDGPHVVYELARVRKVHLKYVRTKQRAYFHCYLHTDVGKVTLRHVHWGGVLNFEDRRASYTPFVLALLAVLSRYPGVRFKGGSLADFVLALIGAPVLALMTWLAVSFGLWIPAAGGALGTFICLAILGRSRPRAVDPANPPRALLPL